MLLFYRLTGITKTIVLHPQLMILAVMAQSSFGISQIFQHCIAPWLVAIYRWQNGKHISQALITNVRVRNGPQVMAHQQMHQDVVTGSNKRPFPTNYSRRCFFEKIHVRLCAIMNPIMSFKEMLNADHNS